MRCAPGSSLIGRQEGAALVVSMLLLTLLSMITLSSADQSVMQERMASNQHSQANSFLAAEAGIIAAKDIANDETIKEAVLSGDADAIESAWTERISQYETWSSVDDSTGAAEFRISRVNGRGDYWDKETKTFEIVSRGRLKTGTHSRANRALGAQVAPAQISAGSSPFVSALVGREGVTIGNGPKDAPQLDTYNSDYGAYGSEVTIEGETFINSNAESNTEKLDGVSAQTCELGSAIYLTGGSPIYGDILGIGNIVSTGGPKIYGSIHVNGDAGDANSNFNGYVYGNFTVGGNAYFGNNAHIFGDVIAGYDVLVNHTENPPTFIRAGGEIDSKPNEDNFDYKGHQSPADLNITEINPDDAQCGSEQSSAVADKFSEARNDPEIQLLQDWLIENDCAAGGSCFSNSAGVIELSGNDNVLSLGKVGKQTLLEVPANLSMTGSLAELEIRGDVTLVVEGTFDLGDRTTLKIGSTGTLTLLVTGKTTFSSGTNISLEGSFVRENTDGESMPAISIQTVYGSDAADSGPGITLAGGNSYYLAVYAPDASVDVVGGGKIYGSIFANKINTTNGGSIYYDEALKQISFGDNRDPELTDARLASWWEITTGQ